MHVNINCTVRENGQPTAPYGNLNVPLHLPV